MIKSSGVFIAVVLLLASSSATEREVIWDSYSHDSPKSPKGILNKRTNDVLDETPPSTPPEKSGGTFIESRFKSRKQLALGEEEGATPSKAELNGHLDTLCKTIFRERKSAAGNGVKAGKFYQQAMSENGLTDSSVINKIIHIISLQCSLWDCNNSLFSQRMETLRAITRNLDSCIEGRAKGHLINVFVLIENSLFRKGCSESLDRDSLKTFCDAISSSLRNAADEEGFLPDCLVHSGHLIMEICDGLKSALSSDEVLATQQLKAVLEQAVGSAIRK
ncbi:MAG: hypothetical protein K2Y18_07985 [Alphaproteobacteria bacterium]|jgi:hypothetical protein|nr:hypothetical protein [Alphaproteobacteria bacterium]